MPIRTAATERRRSGFTLIEIIAVVAILALAATMVVAYLDVMLPSTRMQAAARGLAAVIAECRSFSISQGYSYQIEYDLDGNRYRIATPFQPGGGIARRPEDRLLLDWAYVPDRVDLASVTIGGGESMERGRVIIDFDPLGSTVQHDVYLYRETPKKEYTLQVDGLTGLIHFHEGPPRQEVVDEADFR